MKIIYYVTDHGLGHASRAVAMIRELQGYGVEVIVRANSSAPFFKKSISKMRIIRGRTDFTPIMDKENGMKFDTKLTNLSIKKWIKKLPIIIENEILVIKKERPNLIISDVSIMPLLVAKKTHTKSLVISNFVWSDTVDLDESSRLFFEKAYKNADLIIKLPFGSKIKFHNKKNFGLIARRITEKREMTRKKLGITKGKKLVTISLKGLKVQPKLQKNKNIEILDISNYNKINKFKQLNLAEGQNIINASDLVICKCGYGFISECLSYGTKFKYVLEPTHKEANKIHLELLRRGLRNRISIEKLENLSLNSDFIESVGSLKIKDDNKNIAKQVLNLSRCRKCN